MNKLLRKIKNALLRAFWTQKRVNKWLNFIVPKGAVLANDIVEKAMALGIPDDRFVKARETLDHIVFDGDGGNLVMWMRRDSPYFYNLPIRTGASEGTTYTTTFDMSRYYLGADVALSGSDYSGFARGAYDHPNVSK